MSNRHRGYELEILQSRVETVHRYIFLRLLHYVARWE